jgi:hypothetical protein
MHQVGNWTRFTLAALLYILLPSSLSATADYAVWELGKFDQSPNGFATNRNSADPSYLPPFKVRQSVATRDWPAAQVGSENRSGASRPHPHMILKNYCQIDPASERAIPENGSHPGAAAKVVRLCGSPHPP